jgi:hypothetical protein
VKSPDSAKEQLLEQLMVAAREQDRTLRATQRPRRRRRRVLGLFAAVVLGGAAAAGAAELISTGEPVPDRTLRGPRSEPPSGQSATIVAKAGDPDAKTTWGVGVYTSATGRPCVLAGQVRGYTLGLIRGGSFHPYAPGTSGICAKDSARPLVYDRLTIHGAQPRTVVFGIANGPVTATLNGKSSPVRRGRGGAFLVVYSGTLPLDQPQLDVGS